MRMRTGGNEELHMDRVFGIEREEEYLAISDARIRHWDKADKGWLGADIQSDHDKEDTEAPEVDAFDFFGDV